MIANLEGKLRRSGETADGLWEGDAAAARRAGEAHVAMIADLEGKLCRSEETVNGLRKDAAEARRAGEAAERNDAGFGGLGKMAEESGVANCPDEQELTDSMRILLDLVKNGSLRGVNLARRGVLLSGLIAVLESGSEDYRYLGMMAVEVYKAPSVDLEGALFRCGEVRNGFVLATEMNTGTVIGGLHSQFTGNEVIVNLAQSDDYLLSGYWLNEVVKSTGRVGRHNAMLFIYSKGHDSQHLRSVFAGFKGFDRILHATS